MRAGSLRHSITVDRRLLTLNDLGQDNEATWSSISGRIPCEVKELSGRESEIARQQVAEATVQITCRFISILTTDRIIYGDRVFQPESIVTDQRNTKLTILCSETK
jgi:head-tail adaptor